MSILQVTLEIPLDNDTNEVKEEDSDFYTRVHSRLVRYCRGHTRLVIPLMSPCSGMTHLAHSSEMFPHLCGLVWFCRFNTSLVWLPIFLSINYLQNGENSSWHSRSVLSKRNIIYDTLVILNFLVTTLTKVKTVK